jgi:ketol-acid reductoisomerase
MAEVLKEVRAGHFADDLKAEEQSGYARLERERAANRDSEIEQARRRLDDGQ